MPPLRLEVFEPETAGADGVVVTDLGAMEEARLAAYEQGYAAGWDDAVAAQGAEQARIRADLARNLQALGFTYHEARTHVLKAVEPLIEAVLGRLVPETARLALAPRVVEALRPLLAAAAEVPVIVTVNPAARAAIEPLLAETPALPLRLCEEETLGEGQAHLRFGDVETRIDLDRAAAEILQAVRDFFTLSRQENAHG
jgi:flagellar assembly protein FliH